MKFAGLFLCIIAGIANASADPPQPQLPADMRVIAFIFDDSPNAQSTAIVLDTLKAAGMRATFSLVGAEVLKNPDLARRIVAEGHEIANGTQSNRPLSSLSPEEGFEDIRAGAQTIQRVTGVTPKLLRAPAGEDGAEVQALAAASGLAVLKHTLDSGDWRNPPPGKVTRTIIEGLVPQLLILLHESFPAARRELPAIVAEMSRRSYTSITFSELAERRRQ